MDETQIRADLAPLLHTALPVLTDAQRRALIDAVPLFLWSIYSGRTSPPPAPRLSPAHRGRR